MEEHRITVGDEVLVTIPVNEQASNPAAKYNGQKMLVTRRVYKCGGKITYFELEDAESKYGIPYAFLGEWLRKI